MKKIGIIVAMDSELMKVLGHITGVGDPEIHTGLTVYKGSLDENEVVVCKSGIGKVNAALATHTIITVYKPNYIINTGVAGSLDSKVVSGDCVVGSGVKYYDVWCGGNNARGQIQGEPEWFPCISVNAEGKGFDKILRKYTNRKHLYGIHRAPIVSGDWFMETMADKLKAKRACGRAKAVDMESGAIAQVCCRYGVSFLPIRVISDVVGEPQHGKRYDDFWKDMADRSFDVLMELIAEINGKD